MVGYDPRDPTSLRQAPISAAAEATSSSAGLRLGIPRQWDFDLYDSAVEQATRAATEALVADGATLVEVELPHSSHAHAIGWTIMYAEFASLHEVTYDRIGDYGEGMTRQLLVNSQFVSAQDYLRALRARHLIQRDFEAVFAEVDALIVPGPITAAPRLSDKAITVNQRSRAWLEVIARPTLIFNLAGVPALSLPAGTDHNGLPVGIQIVAPPLHDTTCLAVGAAYQRLTDHHLASPAQRLLTP
jgi:aspartyl-tRNA(Asn)/glutamyl-tRNA(Gln) amidotransferase subunit A